MGEFSLPTNIRQIGSIGDGMRIYMEDYVFTYLHQFAEAGGYDERAAFLVGRHMVIDGGQVLFIHGAVQGKELEIRDGLLFFSDKTNEYTEAMIKEYFSGMEVVGWMQSQPSYGVYLNQQYAAYHRHVFPRDYQVMFVMDPLEKTNSFYAFNSERDAMQEVRGYFIYYDKNKNMHEYMLRDRATDKASPPSAYVEVFGERDAKTASDTDEDETREEEERYDSDYKTDTATRAEELIKRRAGERSRKRSAVVYKRTMNLMTGLSAALFIACFVMGAGLIQNRDRISSIETQLTQLSTAYRNLFVQMSSDGTLPAFAATGENENTPAESPVGGTDGTTGQTESVPPEEAQSANANDFPDSESLTVDTLMPEEILPEEIASVDVPSEEPIAAEPAETPAEELAVTEPEEIPAEEAAQTDSLPAEVAVTEETEESAVPEAHTIQPGDSLLGISLEYYGNANMVDDILALNGLANADMIVSGKTIALPRP